MNEKALPALPSLRVEPPLAPPPLALRPLLAEKQRPTPVEEKAKTSIRELLSTVEDLYHENARLRQEARRTYVTIATTKRQNQLYGQALDQQKQRMAHFVRTINQALGDLLAEGAINQGGPGTELREGSPGVSQEVEVRVYSEFDFEDSD